jgi:hypothetical protein
VFLDLDSRMYVAGGRCHAVELALGPNHRPRKGSLKRTVHIFLVARMGSTHHVLCTQKPDIQRLLMISSGASYLARSDGRLRTRQTPPSCATPCMTCILWRVITPCRAGLGYTFVVMSHTEVFPSPRGIVFALFSVAVGPRSPQASSCTIEPLAKKR